MKFRPHSFGGDLDSSMAGLIEFDGLAGLMEYLKVNHPPYGPEFRAEDVELVEYWPGHRDDRIGWEKTYLVKQKHWGVVGFTDGDGSSA